MKAPLVTIGQQAIPWAAECGSDKTLPSHERPSWVLFKDIESDGLDIDGVPHIYVSTYQDASKQVSVVLRTSLHATLLEPQIRHEIQKH